MAAGSRTKYALDLNDIFAFPDGDNIPLSPPNTEEGESWVVLLQVGLLSAVSNANMDVHSAKKIMGTTNPSSGLTYATVDITGKLFNVEINTSNPYLDTIGYKRGYTICILNAQPLHGANSQFYYKVDDISTVEVRFSNCFLSDSQWSSSFSCFLSHWLSSGSSTTASECAAMQDIFVCVCLAGILAD